MSLAAAPHCGGVVKGIWWLVDEKARSSYIFGKKATPKLFVSLRAVSPLVIIGTACSAKNVAANRGIVSRSTAAHHLPDGDWRYRDSVASLSPECRMGGRRTFRGADA
jgi:hypothetical protein